MGDPNLATSEKSTTVRAISGELRWLRWGFRALSALATGAAERRAAELFFTPRRSRRAASLAPAGLIPLAFAVSDGGERLAAWSWGDGPTVLLVHGWEGYAAQLAPFVAPLVAAGLRVVAFDLPAHGASTGRTTNVIEMARAIRAVAAVTGPAHAIVAHSLGGAASALALAEGLVVDRVVLLAPAAEPGHFARKLATMAGLSSARTDGMLREIARRLGGLALDVPELAQRMTAPALVFHDAEDREVPFAHGRALSEAWPNARLVQLSKLGHRRLLRDSAVIQRVVEFVTERRSDGRASLVGDLAVLDS